MKWLAVFFCFLLLAGTVFSLTDRESVVGDITKLVSSTTNIKEYNSLTETAVILSPTGTTEYASIKLLTPKRMQVGAGYQKVAEFEINSKVAYADFLKQMYFFDMKKNNAGIKRGFDLKVLTTYLDEEPVYENVCEKPDDLNKGYIACNIREVGTQQVTKTRYDLLTEKNFGIEKQTVSIWTNVEIGDSIEWIPELYGTLITEWAIWDYNLQANLKGYWKMEDASGNLLDSSGNGVTGTSTSLIYGQSGKVNNDVNFYQPSTYGKFDLNNSSYFIPTNFTWCFWGRKTNSENDTWFWLTRASGLSNQSSYQFNYGWQQATFFTMNNTAGTEYKVSYGNVAQNEWHHYCGSFDGTTLYGWLDGVLKTPVGFSGSVYTSALTTRFGGRSDNYTGLKGALDEVAFFDRNLSGAEVAYLYNSGTGTTYCGAGYVDAFDDVCTGFAQVKLDFNVYQTSTSTHLTNVDMDCNVNAFDLNNQSSPFSSTTTDINTVVSCNFSRANYDTNTRVFKYDSNKTIVVYLAPNPAKARITWNIYRTGTSSHLTGVTADCNVNAMDFTSQNSPVTGALVDIDTAYSCVFSRTGYADSSAQIGKVDSNKTVTVYLSDTTAPTMGQTYTDANVGFKIFGSYIKGTGSIWASASDAGSGIASCYYSLNEGTTPWILTTDGNSTHCKKNGIIISNATTYKFDLNAVDNAGNSAKGTATSTYTGDTIAPVTTVTITDYNNTPYKFIHATCADAGVGCKGITLEFDNNGTKFYKLSSTYDWNYNGLGYHSVKYYSTDYFDTNETPRTIDLNMPVLLTIKYPKNIATLVQLTEKWILRAEGALTLNLTDLTTDYNVYVLPGTLTTFYIGDVNGNYTQSTYTRTYYQDSNTGYDILQPYLYAINTSLATTINIIGSSTNQPIPDVTLKIYGNLPGIGNTLIGQGTSDSKGQILQLFIAGQSYVFETYYEGVLIKTFNITASSTTIFLILTLSDINIVQPTASGFSANWTPGNALSIGTGNQVFTQTLSNFGGKTITIASTLTQNGVNLAAPQNYAGSSDKTFTYTIAWAGITSGTVVSKMVVTTSDGNVYTFTNNHLVGSSYGAGYNPLIGLSQGLRADMACSSDPLVPCFPLLIMAILICIGLTLWASIQFGVFAGQSTGLIFLIGMILFTFLTWIPVWVTAGLVLIILAFIVNERR